MGISKFSNELSENFSKEYQMPIVQLKKKISKNLPKKISKKLPKPQVLSNKFPKVNQRVPREFPKKNEILFLNWRTYFKGIIEETNKKFSQEKTFEDFCRNDRINSLMYCR